MASDFNWLMLASWGLCPMVWTQDLITSESCGKESTHGRKVGGDCRTAEDCQKTTANTTCTDGFCTCQDGFSISQRMNITSCEPSNIMQTGDFDSTPQPPGGPKHRVDPKMIVIMVVLAVMFVGICVALHLFSKARFRNHRTIFNSPHPRLMHIKLGKKKGGRRTSHASLEPPGSRQLSICSQLSPLQSRRGSQTASPDSGRRTQVGAREKKEGHGSLTRHYPDPATSTSLPNHHQSKKDSQRKGVSSEYANGPDSPKVIVSTGQSHPSPPSPNSSSTKKV